MKSKTIKIELPAWLQQFLKESTEIFPTHEAQMRFAIELSRKNIEIGTGGPFGAAIFDMDSGRLISAGVNMVTTSGFSFAHAEIMAITQTQALLGSFNLSGAGMPHCVLVSSTAPCAMCLGAVPWSGVKALICGARDEDARAVGFDEGSKRDDWVAELQKRGITVFNDVLREAAAKVLSDYFANGGILY